MNTQAEMLDVVNEKDEVIGQDLKSDKIAKGLISRVAAVFLVDFEGQFIITKRSEQKVIDPGLYDLAAVGSVLAGESYEDGMRREIKEELLIDCELEMLDKFYQEINHQDKKLKFFCAVFFGRTEQIPVLNEEVAEFRKMSFEEIKKETMKSPEKFCPGFLKDFRKVEKKLLLKI